jgi:hypothetical protein
MCISEIASSFRVAHKLSAGQRRTKWRVRLAADCTPEKNNVNERIGDDSDLVEWVSGGAIVFQSRCFRDGSEITTVGISRSSSSTVFRFVFSQRRVAHHSLQSTPRAPSFRAFCERMGHHELFPRRFPQPSRTNLEGSSIKRSQGMMVERLTGPTCRVGASEGGESASLPAG